MDKGGAKAERGTPAPRGVLQMEGSKAQFAVCIKLCKFLQPVIKWRTQYDAMQVLWSQAKVLGLKSITVQFLEVLVKRQMSWLKT